MKRLAPRTRKGVVMFPVDLYERMVRRAGTETRDSSHRVTPSDIVRYAVEEYLDAWETATFVRADDAAPVATGKDE